MTLCVESPEYLYKVSTEEKIDFDATDPQFIKVTDMPVDDIVSPDKKRSKKNIRFV